MEFTSKKNIVVSNGKHYLRYYNLFVALNNVFSVQCVRPSWYQWRLRKMYGVRITSVGNAVRLLWFGDKAERDAWFEYIIDVGIARNSSTFAK